MELKELLSGIAVVIDDALNLDDDAPGPESSASDDRDRDPICGIVRHFEQELNMPFFKAKAIPPRDTWENLLDGASFVLLDWKLWPEGPGGSALEASGIKRNREFLKEAKRYSVPVFVFTNESEEDIRSHLNNRGYNDGAPESGSLFIQAKSELLSGDGLDLGRVLDWVRNNVSVYVMRKWDAEFREARRTLFVAMNNISPNWPRVFWRAYQDDGVDPSFGLTQLIGDGLLALLRTNAFTSDMIGDPDGSGHEVPGEDIRSLIEATAYRKVEPKDDIRCGDVFTLPKQKYLLNIRPDCDCVPRDGKERDEVELYCIQGKRMRGNEVNKAYSEGHFLERTDESIVFGVIEGKSVNFKFKEMRICTFGCLKGSRIGRLLHPYITRIQQRYGLYLQRQGLPRIPPAAVLGISEAGNDAPSNSRTPT